MEEQSLFVKYLGDTPFVRVLDFMIENEVWDYSLQDISDNTGLARNTVSKILDKMLELGLVVQTRAVGKAKLFQINKKEPAVMKLIKFDRELSLGSVSVKAKELVRL